MRDIKFRAWSKKFGGMIYPYDKLYSIDVHASTVWQDLRDDECAELMQFTGLKDKNGKDIYEGDILQVGEYQKRYEIVFSNNEGDEIIAAFCMRNEENFFAIDTYAVQFGTVIGNIYQNPDPL